MKQFWDEKYLSEVFLYGTGPNAFFARCLEHLPPGRILLPGEGEGRNAVYAARKGWEVTAVDQSSVARSKALALAEKTGVQISYEICDLTDDCFPDGPFDVIALIYLHLPPADRIHCHRRLMEHLSRGGVLFGEFFHLEQLKYSSGGPKHPDLLYTSAILADDFAGYDIKLISEESVMLNEGPGHSGKASVVRLIVKK